MKPHRLSPAPLDHGRKIAYRRLLIVLPLPMLGNCISLFSVNRFTAGWFQQWPHDSAIPGRRKSSDYRSGKIAHAF